MLFPELKPWQEREGKHNIFVYVTPRASKERLGGVVHKNNQPMLRAYVCAAPEDGKANDAVIKLLAEALQIARSRVSLLRGFSHRQKVFLIEEATLNLDSILAPFLYAEK